MSVPSSMEGLAVEFSDPFELVVARPVPEVLHGTRPPGQALRIGGRDYRIEPVPALRVPDLPVRPDPALTFADLYRLKRMPPTPSPPDPPRVLLRKALRACLADGVPSEDVSDIVRLEFADFVMGS